ncbi:MAG TPA: hypothetical protein ENN17_05660 [bacterium]|nr:hypothetical protein [bacterium]
MVQHPHLRLWEQKLKRLLDDLDEVLEDAYGHKYHLHPARRGRGATANRSHDGLFDITANFTLGLGSERGKGYVIDIRMVTLEKISEEVRTRIEELAMRHIQKKLKEFFPDRDLWIDRDGHLLKLHGDLSLGTV